MAKVMSSNGFSSVKLGSVEEARAIQETLGKYGIKVDVQENEGGTTNEEEGNVLEQSSNQKFDRKSC